MSDSFPIYSHVHDWVINPVTYQPMCSKCQKTWKTITDDPAREEKKKGEDSNEAYERAMRGIKP